LTDAVTIILVVSGAIMLLSMLISFVRFLIGPDYLNRVVAFDAMTIMSLSGIALLSYFLGRMLYLDVALVYGLLSFLGVVAVARFGEGEL
jgi:multicomponent Na+:H+ antiporter subunit F